MKATDFILQSKYDSFGDYKYDSNDNEFEQTYTLKEVKTLMIDFAKYHVKKALEIVANNAYADIEFLDSELYVTGVPEEDTDFKLSVNKESVLDSYNLDNIE